VITERDLQEAILECEGKRNPDASTCIKLAAFYTIRNELFGNFEQQEMSKNPGQLAYSFAAPPITPTATIEYQSGTDFSRLINGRDPVEVWPIIDELVSAVRVIQPRLYNSFIQRLE